MLVQTTNQDFMFSETPFETPGLNVDRFLLPSDAEIRTDELNISKGGGLF